MIKIKINYTKAFMFLSALLLIVGCAREEEELDPAQNPIIAEVFIDGFSAGLNYAAFGGSDVTAFDVDMNVKYSGTSSMRISVPDFEDPKGAYAGGVYFTEGGRDLSQFDALTFWARASRSANIAVVGLGNDLGENKFESSLQEVPVNTNWKKYYIPLPDASKLTDERGMFYYSEGPEDGEGYTIWFDEVKFEKLGTIAFSEASILNGEDQVVQVETGASYTLNGTVTFNLPNGIDQDQSASSAYFNFESSNPTVASVDDNGVVNVLAEGNAVITASLGETPVVGSLTIQSSGDPVVPGSAAPSPTEPAEDVISIFSDVYQDEPVDFYNGYWEFSTTQSETVEIDGDEVLRYTMLNFVGIQFTSPTIDVSEMTHFHIDIWTPDATALPNTFKVLLVDLGPDGSCDGSDNSSQELTFTAPTLMSESWVSIDVPLSDFAGLVRRGNLAQIVLSGDIPNVFADNIYFYKGENTGGPTDPTIGAPNPTQDASDVISIFSDSYDNVEGTDFNPDWGQGTVVTQEDIGGNNTLKYTGLDYQGVQFAGSVDVSGMDFLHIDYWTSNSSALNTFLISPGPQETPFAMPVPTNEWESVDIPLSTFSGVVDLAEVIQMKFDGNGTIYLDNIYFYRGGMSGGDDPTIGAPDPTEDAANVLSIYSDSYDNVMGTNFNPDWGQGTVFSEENIAGNNTIKFTGLDYQGVEFASSLNVGDMEFLHLDVWTSNSSALNTFLISPGPQETPYAMPVPTSGWESVDIPLSAFSGVVDLADVIQMKFDGNGTIYLDNIYFYKSGGMSGGDEPTMGAPDPTLPAGNVISLFSGVYDDVPVDTWRTDWSSADFEDVTIDGNPTKKYSSLDFVGIETVANQIDASGMTHFSIDVWSRDFTYFAIKLVDFGADGAFGGGDDVEHEVQYTMPSQGTWITYDIPLSDFVNLTTRSNIAQLILVGQPTGANTVFVDNIYFHD